MVAVLMEVWACFALLWARMLEFFVTEYILRRESVTTSSTSGKSMNSLFFTGDTAQQWWGKSVPWVLEGSHVPWWPQFCISGSVCGWLKDYRGNDSRSRSREHGRLQQIGWNAHLLKGHPQCSRGHGCEGWAAVQILRTFRTVCLV